jgi:hypothetical protein
MTTTASTNDASRAPRRLDPWVAAAGAFGVGVAVALACAGGAHAVNAAQLAVVAAGLAGFATVDPRGPAWRLLCAAWPLAQFALLAWAVATWRREWPRVWPVYAVAAAVNLAWAWWAWGRFAERGAAR